MTIINEAILTDEQKNGEIYNHYKQFIAERRLQNGINKNIDVIKKADYSKITKILFIPESGNIEKNINIYYDGYVYIFNFNLLTEEETIFLRNVWSEAKKHSHIFLKAFSNHNEWYTWWLENIEYKSENYKLKKERHTARNNWQKRRYN